MREINDYPILKVCSKYYLTGKNCQKCEKCARTIIGLLSDGIDPNKCGFNVDSTTLDYIRESLETGKFFGRRAIAERPIKLINRFYPIFEWDDIKTNVNIDLVKDLYGFKKFLDWFNGFDVKKEVSRIRLTQVPKLFLYSIFDFLAPINPLLPKKIRDILRRSFNFFFFK